ncbi:hypothetical protein RB595_001619 [Gaeumannomyces hyphopodioides]
MSPSGAAFLAGALLGALALAPMTQAQYGGWTKNQVNSTMCFWEQLRGHQMRDTIYLDGGLLGWKPGLSTGEYGSTIADNNPFALMYKLKLGRAFNVTDNITSVLEPLSKAPGSGAGNNIAPNYYDGALLGNDKAFYLYGGLLTKTDTLTSPDADSVYAYRAYQANPESRAPFAPGFFLNRLPTGMTRYLAYGGAASAPSENKAWYFGGQHSPSWGPIYTPSLNDSENAINASNTLITLDMSDPGGPEKWSNVTLLPDSIKGRANPELVWVPYGAQGLLIAIGGATYPDFDNGKLQSANAAASESESKGFTAEVDIYDIAKGKWYRQPTIHSGPGAVTRGCTVVAAAQDMSSVNIYFYGGYNGRDIAKEFSDDVWILSLPSFMWMRVTNGDRKGYGRAGHKCFKPYPDLMMVVGGQRYQPSGDHLCLQDGIIQLFNLTSATWQQSYDPAKWSKYGVPATIFNMIGGTAEGGADLKRPDPSGFANSDIASAFSSPYPTQKIATYYPYASAASNDSTNSNLPGSGNSGSGVPSYVGPVVGVIGGLILITALIAGFCVYRRRHLLKRDQAGASEVGTTDENGNRIMRWMHGQPSERKGPPTVTATEETVFTPHMENGLPIPPKSVQSVPSTTPAPTTYTTASSFPAEMADTQMAELMDTSLSPRNELHDKPLSAAEIVNKYSNLAHQQNNGGSIHSSNLYSSIVQTDHASVVSRSSAPHAASPAPAGAYQGLEPGAPGRPDSPPLGGPTGYDTLGDLPQQQQQQQQQQDPHDQGPLSPVSRLESGVSGISERDRRHLRHLSDETVSSFGAGGVTAAQANTVVSPSSAVAGPGAGGQLHPLVGTPPLVSPPEFGGGDGDDYLSARAAQAQRPPQPPQRGPSSSSGVGSPLRKSVFHEGE